uniref:Uncharacterized protein n=1 Tax=Panagrolaimus sp. ES5 TaxID=591445 RepID=A0AC34FU70_9BILA
MIKFILLLLALSLIYVNSESSESNNDDEPTCQDILEAAGASAEFGFNVGHAIHSISLRTLQKFKPGITEDNRVPTINMNLTADEALLPYAPNRTTPDSIYFHTEGMKILDEVLTHMNDNSYDVKNFSPLEKIAHAFHMEEMWAAALHAYRKLKRHPPSEEICKCTMDIENNGVLKQLRYAALLIREPQLVYGSTLNRAKRGYRVVVGYSKRFKKREIFEQKENKFDADQLVLNETVASPRLINVEGWKKWKDVGVGKLHNHKDAALFLYCALHPPHN